MGLVVTYRTTGLFSFAHGATGMAVAYGFYSLHVSVGLPTAVAIVLALGVIAPVHRHRSSSGCCSGGSTRPPRPPRSCSRWPCSSCCRAARWPSSGPPRSASIRSCPTSTFRLGSVNVGWDQLIIVVLGVAGARRAHRVLPLEPHRHRHAGARRRPGPGAGRRLLGQPPRRVHLGPRRAPPPGWPASSSPRCSASTAASSRCSSCRPTRRPSSAGSPACPARSSGAMVLGLAGTLSLKVFSGEPTLLNGLRPSIPFIFLFGALVVRPAGQPPRARHLGAVDGHGAGRRPAPGGRCSSCSCRPPCCSSETRVFSLGFALVIACAFLSLTVLTGTSGLISLTQAGLVGTGAFTYVHLTNGGVPFPLALLLGGLVVVPLGRGHRRARAAPVGPVPGPGHLRGRPAHRRPAVRLVDLVLRRRRRPARDPAVDAAVGPGLRGLRRRRCWR